MALVSITLSLIWISIATLLVRCIKKIIKNPETRWTPKEIISIILSIFAILISFCIIGAMIGFYKKWVIESYLQSL